MYEADVESRKFNSNIEKTLEELLYVIQRSIRIILNEILLWIKSFKPIGIELKSA